MHYCSFHVTAGLPFYTARYTACHYCRFCRVCVSVTVYMPFTTVTVVLRYRYPFTFCRVTATLRSTLPFLRCRFTGLPLRYVTVTADSPPFTVTVVLFCVTVLPFVYDSCVCSATAVCCTVCGCFCTAAGWVTVVTLHHMIVLYRCSATVDACDRFHTVWLRFWFTLPFFYVLTDLYVTTLTPYPFRLR